MRTLTFFILLFLLSPALKAEYRVFTLHIIDHQKQSTKQVETTLDPEQYIGFYPLKKNESISYIETWRCRGNTSAMQAHCDNPRLQLDRNPAAKQELPSQSPELLK